MLVNFLAIDGKDATVLSNCFTANGHADSRGANRNPQAGVNTTLPRLAIHGSKSLARR